LDVTFGNRTNATLDGSTGVDITPDDNGVDITPDDNSVNTSLADITPDDNSLGVNTSDTTPNDNSSGVNTSALPVADTGYTAIDNSLLTSIDNSLQSLADLARHVIQHFLNSRLSSSNAF
jgi:hypothetical protein